MCNLYRVRKAAAEIAALFNAKEAELSFDPELDLYPKGMGPVIRQENGERVLDAMHWGIPLTMKGAKGQPVTKSVTNVRNLASPFWKSTIAKANFRCLVPVTEFCEWEG